MDKDCVVVPRELMRFVRKVWLPSNPNKLRCAHPDTVKAAKEFIELTEASALARSEWERGMGDAIALIKRNGAMFKSDVRQQGLIDTIRAALAQVERKA